MRAQGALIVMLLLVGCSALGLQSATISFNRDALLLQYADLKQEYGAVKQLAATACQETTVTNTEKILCGRLGATDAKIQEVDARFRAAIVANKPDLSQIDLAALARLIPQLASLAALVPK